MPTAADEVISVDRIQVHGLAPACALQVHGAWCATAALAIACSPCLVLDSQTRDAHYVTVAANDTTLQRHARAAVELLSSMAMYSPPMSVKLTVLATFVANVTGGSLSRATSSSYVACYTPQRDSSSSHTLVQQIFKCCTLALICSCPSLGHRGDPWLRHFLPGHASLAAPR